MAKANLTQILDSAANVVEAQLSLDKARASGDGTEKRYLDHLQSCIYGLKWMIERDRPRIAKRFKD